VGNIDEESAHPFIEGELIGVHNGSVWDYENIFDKKLHGVNDSHTIYKALAEKGTTEATEVLSALSSGAYALVWYDHRIKSLRFARNSERPLWFYKNQGYWWWNSEPGQIAACLARDSYDPLSYREVVPWQLDTHKLLTIPIDGSPATVEEYVPDPYEVPKSLWGSRWNYNSYNRGSTYDAWADDLYNDAYKKERTTLDEASTKVPWYAIDGPTDLWSIPAYLSKYRLEIRQAIGKLFGRGGPPSYGSDWEECIQDLAERTGTTDKEPVVAFAALGVTDAGLGYGCVTLDKWGPIPIVTSLSQTEHAAMDSTNPHVEGMIPMIQGTLSGVRAYADGTLGLVVSDAQVVSYVNEEDIPVSHKAIGNEDMHPHVAGNKAIVANSKFDWSTWL
jgi:hypothetical protein